MIIFLKDWSKTLRELVSSEAPKDHITEKMKSPLIRAILNFYSMSNHSSFTL